MARNILARSLPALMIVGGFAGCSTLKPNNNPNFGTIYVGESATGTVTWANAKTAKTVIGYSIDPSPPFSRTPAGPFTQFNVAVGASTPALTILFAPSTAGKFDGDVTPQLDEGESASATLTGTAVWHKLQGADFGVRGGNYVQDQALDFGIVNLNGPVAQRTVTRTFILFNGGSAQFALNGSFVNPPGAGPFSISPANPINLAAGNLTNPARSVTVTITFAPAAPGTFHAIAEFRDATHLFGIVCRGSAVRE